MPEYSIVIPDQWADLEPDNPDYFHFPYGSVISDTNPFASFAEFCVFCTWSVKAQWAAAWSLPEPVAYLASETSVLGFLRKPDEEDVEYHERLASVARQFKPTWLFYWGASMTRVMDPEDHPEMTTRPIDDLDRNEVFQKIGEGVDFEPTVLWYAESLNDADAPEDFSVARISRFFRLIPGGRLMEMPWRSPQGTNALAPILGQFRRDG